jgi:hypothetical protein
MADNFSILGQSNFTEEDLAHLDMEQVEEAILRIFKNSGLGSVKKGEVGSLNFEFSNDEANELSEEKRKLFDTIKEGKYKKKEKNNVEASYGQQGHPDALFQQMNKNVIADPVLFNCLLNSQLLNQDEMTKLYIRSQLGQINPEASAMFPNPFLNSLNMGRNDNNLIALNQNIIHNIIGTDYNTNSLPLNNLFDSNILQQSSNPPKSESKTPTNVMQDNETGINEEQNLNDLFKLQNLQQLAEVMKIINNNNMNEGGQTQVDALVNNHTIDPKNILQIISKTTSDNIPSSNVNVNAPTPQNNNIGSQEGLDNVSLALLNNFISQYQNTPTPTQESKNTNYLQTQAAYDNSKLDVFNVLTNLMNNPSQQMDLGTGGDNKFNPNCNINNLLLNQLVNNQLHVPGGHYGFNSANDNLLNIINNNAFSMNLLNQNITKDLNTIFPMFQHQYNLGHQEPVGYGSKEPHNNTSNDIGKLYENLNEQYSNLVNQMLRPSNLDNFSSRVGVPQSQLDSLINNNANH